MGITGLPTLIKAVAPNAVAEYDLEELRNIVAALDASLIVHQTGIAMGDSLKNEKGARTGHLYGIFYKVLGFLQNGIVPIFVFDGKAPNIKNRTLDKRREKRKIALDKLSKLDDREGEEYQKYQKQTFSPSKEDYKELQIMLDLMGIPYINSPGEADVVCAWLASRYNDNGERYVKGVCSDDSDMLALGGKYLFKNMLKFKGKDRKVTVISLHKVLTEMNWTMDKFVDMCVLMGCDYCERIPEIGPKNAYHLIQNHGSLDKAIEFLMTREIEAKKLHKLIKFCGSTEKLVVFLAQKKISAKKLYTLIQQYDTMEKIIKFLEEQKNKTSFAMPAPSSDCNSCGPVPASSDSGPINTPSDIRDIDDSDSEPENQEEDKNKLDMENIACMFEAAVYFKTALTELDESDDFVLTKDNLELRQFQEDELLDFMCVKHGFNVERIMTAIKRLTNYYKIMGIVRKNTKKVHKISKPRSENSLFMIEDGNFDFLPSDEEEMKSKNTTKTDLILNNNNNNNKSNNNKEPVDTFDVSFRDSASDESIEKTKKSSKISKSQKPRHKKKHKDHSEKKSGTLNGKPPDK